VKTLLVIAIIFAALFVMKRMLAGSVLTPAEAAGRVANGTAVLIDVREPDEWQDGVVTGALLLPLSDLRGKRTQWGPVLKTVRDKELIFYCRAGTRAGMSCRLLAGEGFKTANAGGFSAWQAAGQPVRVPKV
jgi:rhodanese-related sulfurtransferase